MNREGYILGPSFGKKRRFPGQDIKKRKHKRKLQRKARKLNRK